MTSVKYPKGWYAILHISEVSNKKPIAVHRLNKNLVVWKDHDQIIIMDDKCPHRSAKLSQGKILNNTIVCPFHGFMFDSNGSCSYAPEFNKSIPGLKVTKYDSKVIADFIWINLFNDDTPLPKFDTIIKLHEDFKGHYSYITDTWDSHVTRCIENQLDYTHLPVVHHNTIGRNFNMPQSLKVVKDEYSIATYQTNDDELKITTEYLFTNAWILHINDKLKLMVYFVPITHEQTKIYVFAYRKFLTKQLIKPLIDIIINITNKIVLRQDKSVVLSQGLTPSYMAHEELLMKHDTAIRYFRELWQNNLTDE